MTANEPAPDPAFAPLPPPAEPAPVRKPWGFWKVLGGTVLALITGEIVAALLSIAYLFLVEKPAGGLTLERLTATQFGLTGWIGSLVVIALCWDLARRCGRGTPSAVLGLQGISSGALLKWCGVALVLCAVNDGVLLLLDQPIVHPSTVELYHEADSKILLLFAIIVLAPLVEEMVFRGWALGGWQPTRLGPRGAVLLTALAWSALHVQYELIGIAQIFVGGLLYGYVRLRTGSILPVIAMHAVNNLWSSVELLVVVAQN